MKKSHAAHRNLRLSFTTVEDPKLQDPCYEPSQPEPPKSGAPKPKAPEPLAQIDAQSLKPSHETPKLLLFVSWLSLSEVKATELGDVRAEEPRQVQACATGVLCRLLSGF